ncbi:hypothetical protein ABIB95_009356 [Bradyrhizobium sp. LA2.1]
MTAIMLTHIDNIRNTARFTSWTFSPRCLAGARLCENVAHWVCRHSPN